MGTLWQDVKYGLRVLAKSPGFTAVAVLTLGLGIGANTAIFSVVHAVLLRSLPYPQPDRLVVLREKVPGNFVPYSVSWMDFVDWRAQNRSFESMAVYRQNEFSLTGFDRPMRIRAGVVSAPFFSLLGAKTVLGRTFTDAEDTPSSAGTAVLSYAFWSGRMGGDTNILGKTLVLDEHAYTIIGVLAPDFRFFQQRTDLYVPAGLNGANPDWLLRPNHPGLTGLGRLRSGVSLAAARADFGVIMQRIDKQYPVTNTGLEAVLRPLYEYSFSGFQSALFILLAAAGCVLLIACANVANLLLARAATRHKEFAVRAAIGAGKRRVVRQLLTESVLLSLIGGAMGLLIALWSMGPLLRIAPQDIPRLSETKIDFSVFLFTFVIAIVTGVLFGLAPAFQISRNDVNAELKECGPGVAAGRPRQQMRSGLLIAEVAIAFVLVVASGLLIRSLSKALGVNPGFRADHLLALEVSLPSAKYKTHPQRISFQEQALDRIRNLPGIESASAAYCAPFAGDCWDSIFYLDDRPVPAVSELPSAVFNIVDPDYFRTMAVPLLAGRLFTAADNDRSARVAVINETFAKRFWPHGNPLGRRIKQDFPQGKADFQQIVGVVGDVSQFGPDQQQWPEVFEPEAQNPATSSMTFVARTKVDPMGMSGAVVDAIQAVDKDLPVANIQPMTQYLAESLARRKFSTMLLSLFGGLALLLAAVGIFGVMAYTVTQRTHEIGIRVALGAQRGDVLDLVLGSGLRLALAGIAIGLLASVALTRLIRSQLFQVSGWDPITYVVVALLLCGVALLAGYLPARRASRVDPIVALRHE